MIEYNYVNFKGERKMNNCKIKNKIITISGEPASGKSTVVRALQRKYEEMGNVVHIVSTGKIFRELAVKAYLNMYPDKTEEDVDLAALQLDVAFAKKRSEIDSKIDTEIYRRGKQINEIERPNDVYIIDSRLAWHNIPESYAVRLTVCEKIAGQRVFADKTRGGEDAYDTVEDAINKTRERKLGEIERYKKRYGLDLTKKENYNLIVDTSYIQTEELADMIINGEKSYRLGKSIDDDSDER